MARPKLLDLFCCAGGAAMGYYLAGFDITGVDIEPQPHYPFPFIQGDALEYAAAHGQEYDAIHASPPCQFAAAIFNPCKPEKRSEHQNLIPATRDILKRLGRPYVIENVKRARGHLINPLMLTGSMFELPIFRDRYFEINPPLWWSPSIPRYDFQPVPISSSSKPGNTYAPAAIMRSAMGIDWMTKMELRQAVPPAYTQFIGEHLLRVIG